MKSTPKNFVSMHSHTGFSTMDGLDAPEEHISAIRESGMSAWCLTEHGHMNSFAQSYLHVKKLNNAGANFKFIPGCEMYIHPDLEQWKLHRQLHESAKKGDFEAQKIIQEQLAQYINPIAPIVDDDDDIVDFETKEKNDEGTATIENEEESKFSRFTDPIKRRHHLVVLPRTSRGLESLFGLVSKGYSEGFYRFPRVDYRMIKEGAAEGDLIASTACLAGPVSYAIINEMQKNNLNDMTPDILDDPVLTEKVIREIGNVWDQLTDSFGEEFSFLELQFNRLPIQHIVNRGILMFADRCGLKDRLVVTADSHYPTPERWRDREIYRALSYASQKKEVDWDKVPLAKEDLKCELYPKNAEQLWEEYLHDSSKNSFYSEWEDHILNAIERTHEIAHNFIEDISVDVSPKLPRSILGKEKSEFKVLVERCKEGLIWRGVDDKPEYIERAKKELEVISSKNFELYFLVESKIMNIGRENMLVGPGRGSGAGSLVNWLLGITDVDPIEWDLSFERFLSPSRSDMPDVDSDFQDRDGMVQLLEKEFGTNNVIPISNYNMMKISTTTKDLAKLFGIEFQEVNIATRGMDNEVKEKVAGKGEAKASIDVDYDMAYEHHEPFRVLMDKYPELAKTVKSIGSQMKSLGRHAGGVIISDDVMKKMPVIKGKKGFQTPWAEGARTKQLEPLGWIKFDILGLETLAIISRAIELILENHENVSNVQFKDIRKWYDEHLDPKVINFNDEEVYKNIYDQGKWFGIFQCTQSGAQKLFQESKPRSIVDIATLTSIYRPGPLGANVDKLYLDYRDDKNKIPEMSEAEWGVVEKTYGLIIFQEQVMAIANKVGGFPLEQTDDVRRAISKPKQYADKIPSMREQFIDYAVRENDLTKDYAEKLWEKLIYFSAYGFNKSHAISYAMVSYYCAWLLNYYPDEWICAWCESMSGKPEDRAVAYRTLRQWGLEIIPISATLAEEKWRIVESGKYMPSLASAKGVGASAFEELKSKRPFKTMDELLFDSDKKYQLSKLNTKAIRALIQIGAFDEFIGEDKDFKNSAHMIKVVVDNNKFLKKSLKRNPIEGYDNYRSLILEHMFEPPIPKTQRIKDHVSILGSVDPNLIVTKKLQNLFSENSILPLGEFNDESPFCWFIITSCEKKTTKTGKEYLRMSVIDTDMAEFPMNCWDFPSTALMPEPWSVGMGIVSQNKFGLSTNWKKLKIINMENMQDE